MTQRLRPRANLTDVFCDHHSMVANAMEGDGRYPIKLSTGHTVIFSLEGDYLAARVTPEQAKELATMSVFDVAGFERKSDPVAAVESFMAEGERLFQKRQGRGEQSGTGGITELLKGLGLEGLLAERLTSTLAQQINDEANRRAQEKLAADEARRAEHSGEFGFVRLSEELTDDQVIGLMNTHLPEKDPATIKAAARVTLIGKAAAHDLSLQSSIRNLIGSLED